MEDKQTRSERMKESFKRSSLTHDEQVRMSLRISHVNARIAKTNEQLFREIRELREEMESFSNYPTLQARLSANIRLLEATRLGLERNILRHFEAELRDEIRRNVEIEMEKSDE